MALSILREKVELVSNYTNDFAKTKKPALGGLVNYRLSTINYHILPHSFRRALNNHGFHLFFDVS